MVYLAFVVIVKGGWGQHFGVLHPKQKQHKLFLPLFVVFLFLIFSSCFLYHIILDIYIVVFSSSLVLLFNKHALNFILLVHRSSIEVYYP